MSSNVEKEIDLYAPMGQWLKKYLTDNYKKSKIIVIDSHAKDLYVVLNEIGILDYFPQTVGLNIQIDVLGVVIGKNTPELFFIEAKKTPLTLQNLGQLWVYCKLCNPTKAFLFSSAGLGALQKVIVALNREDLLDFGDRKYIKKMQLAKWDVDKNSLDFASLVPKM